MKKNKKIADKSREYEAVKAYHETYEPLGSYTGNPATSASDPAIEGGKTLLNLDKKDQPVQDADDL